MILQESESENDDDDNDSPSNGSSSKANGSSGRKDGQSSAASIPQRPKSEILQDIVSQSRKCDEKNQ